MKSSEKSIKKEYKPSEIEARWQAVWEKEKIYSPDLRKAKKPFYNLMMFPYPSAEGMHVGNMYAFTGADVYGRFQRMRGNDVFEPIGLDGFGIHSENYAIKIGNHPVEQAKISEKKFYRQLHSIGNGFDWTRTVETYKPNYYKWTQWLFIQLFKAGLAYRKKAPVNFCPSCKTVLADEQVIQKVKSQKSKVKNTTQNSKVEEAIGVCERCETAVEKRDLEQWFFKITKYADRLLNNIDKLDWSEKVKIAQRQWIGKSEGARINFEINNNENYILLHGFTGSPDVNFFPWLKNELEKKNHKVYSPHLPNTNDPDINEQVKFVFENASFDHNTVLFGHSLGGVVALKVAEKLKKPIKKLVLAAGFAQPKFLDHSRPFEKKFDWNFDFEKIKKNVREVVILRAQNDTAVPQERSDYIKSKIGGKIVDFIAEEDHICGEKEPVVLKNLVDSIEVFTTRQDTLYGATFLVLAPEHPIVSVILNSFQNLKIPKQVRDDIKKYIENAKKKTEQERMVEEKEKTGVFSGLYAINPINNEKIPIWIADYALMEFGTGALFGDAHDERDVVFARKYGIPLKPTLKTGDKEKDKRIISLEECFTGEGILFNSGEFSGLTSKEAREKIKVWLEKHNAGGTKTTYHLRDWLISRQRYWGPPIPMIYCEECKWQAVPEKDLPVLLPYIKDYKPLGTGQAPLASHPEFYKTRCPNCGKHAKRETDVSDTFLDSSWYFLRYTSADMDSSAFDADIVKKWLPVNMYIGGAEHSVLHLLYARFITMALHDLGHISFEEPFEKFRAHGLLVKDGAKMSKSKGNVVIPDEYIRKFGADTLRTYLMFMGPFSQGGDFRDSGIEGMFRFLKRVWTLIQQCDPELVSGSKSSGGEMPKQVRHDSARRAMMHRTIKKVTEDISNLRYNTAIASLMEWNNYLSEKLKVKIEKLTKEEAETFVKLLAPFAPHMTEELFLMINDEGLMIKEDKYNSIHVQPWPTYDPKFLEVSEVTIVVQVNGKLRDTILVQSSILRQAQDKVQSYVEQAAMSSDKIKKYLEGKQIKKVIYVEGKVINFVTT